jgi:hypothetical protein
MPERIRDIHSAVLPDSVSATMALTSRWLAVYMVAMAIASSVRSKTSSMRWCELEVERCFSADTQALAMASTALTG